MEDIVKAVTDAGVIGAGGGGFPAHIKLSAQAEYAVANGSECEPLLQSDQMLMSQYPEEVVQGLKLLQKATGASQGILALKEKYQPAIEALSPLVEKEKDIRLHLLGDYYPAGDEVVLVYETTGRRVPEGGLPPQVGVMVSNVETLFNISRAVRGEVVTDKFLTVAGEVHQPKVIKVPIGTRAEQVIEWAGGVKIGEWAVLCGGPNMGELISPSAPVTKITNALLVLPADHSLVSRRQTGLSISLKRAKAACCYCRYCSELCPRYLMGHSLFPHKIMRSINLGLDEHMEVITSAFLCSECGLCESYACPMELSPRFIAREIKSLLSAKGITNPHLRNSFLRERGWEERRVPLDRLTARLGIRDYDKQLTVDLNTYSPSEVVVNLDQHTGAPSVPLVKKGDTVKIGQLIADIPKGRLGAKYHAPIAGRVKEVTSTSILIKAER